MGLISADGFKQILKAKSDLLRTGCPDNQYGLFLKRVSQMVDLLPEVEAEPVKHGHIFMQKRISCTLPACSCCEGLILDEEYAYCPWCGAKMDEEARDEAD